MGPVGAIGRQRDEVFGLPDGHHQREWAVGMKMVVDLPESCTLEPGTVFHTFGCPEPEIFGFLYVHPDRIATAGIFVPSWFRSPMRTSYRYLQHFVQHPYIWRHLQGGKPAVVGREIVAGVRPAQRASVGRRRLCAHRRGLGQHKRPDRLRRR
jgi:electron-transferring-flavoprotein dehydrogenase